MINIKVNGIEKKVKLGTSLITFLDYYIKNLKATIVIEYNSKILKKEEWNAIIFQDNDIIEIINFVGGG